MVFLVFTTGLLLGIICGIFIEKYAFAYLDTLFDMFSIRKAEEATGYNLNMQIMQCEVIRSYPELKENSAGSNYEQTNVIGFQYNPEDDEEYYYEEEDIGK